MVWKKAKENFGEEDEERRGVEGLFGPTPGVGSKGSRPDLWRGFEWRLL